MVRRRQDVHLVVAGPDNDGWGGRVRDWLQAAGLADYATFTGMLLGEEKLAALRDAQMFVLPSYSENFGLAVVEAMACGLPVVISDQVNIWREVAAAGAGLVGPCEATRPGRRTWRRCWPTPTGGPRWAGGAKHWWPGAFSGTAWPWPCRICTPGSLLIGLKKDKN